MAEGAVRRSDAAEFVRGLSAQLTMREMDEAVKAAGFDLSHARVYQIRSQEKLGYKRAPSNQHKATPKPKKKKKKKPTALITAREALEAIPKKPDTSAAHVLRKLAFQIGIERLEELIRELKSELGM